MSSPSSVLTPYKPGLFSGKGVIVTGGGTGLGYAIGTQNHPLLLLFYRLLSIPRQRRFTSRACRLTRPPPFLHHP